MTNSLRILLKTILIIITLTLLYFAADHFAPETEQPIALGATVRVIDVRSPSEFATGHYRGAINIPFGTIENHLDQFADDQTTYIVYCRSGNRSGKAYAQLKKAGIKTVVDGVSQQKVESLLNKRTSQ